MSVLERAAYGVKYVPRKDDSSDESPTLSDYDEPVKPTPTKKKMLASAPAPTPAPEVRRPARALVTLAPSAETVEKQVPKVMRGRQLDVLRHVNTMRSAQIDRTIFGVSAIVGENPAPLISNCERVGRLQLSRVNADAVLAEYYARIMGQVHDEDTEVPLNQLQHIDRVPRARSRSRSRKPNKVDSDSDFDNEPAAKPKSVAKPKRVPAEAQIVKPAAKRSAKPAAKKIAKK